MSEKKDGLSKPPETPPAASEAEGPETAQGEPVNAAPQSETALAVPEPPEKVAARQIVPLTSSPRQIMGEWPSILQIAQGIHESRLAPSALRTPQAIATVILKGAELGLPPMQSVNSLHVVEGKVGMSAELMRGLIYQRCPGAKITTVETTDTICTLEGCRNGQEPMLVSFTIEDARKQNLIKDRGAWTKDPKDMLYARATSRLGRRMFPDVLMGCYTPEELVPDAKPAARADPMAPDAPSRAERPANGQANGDIFSSKEYRDLIAAFRHKFPASDGEQFRRYCIDQTGGIDLEKGENWTMGIIRDCTEALKR